MKDSRELRARKVPDQKGKEEQRWENLDKCIKHCSTILFFNLSALTGLTRIGQFILSYYQFSDHFKMSHIKSHRGTDIFVPESHDLVTKCQSLREFLCSRTTKNGGANFALPI